MTAQDIRENAKLTVSAEEYEDVMLVCDGWLLVDRHAWQILMMDSYNYGRYVVYVWNPVKNVVRRAVITAYVNVWITEGDE